MPSEDTQFKPGNNANPNGRPKGSKDIKKTCALQFATFMDCFAGDEEFYVYGHINKSGETVYIGKGSGNRAWTMVRGKRNDKWGEEFLANGEFKIRIFASSLTQKDALAVESALIKAKQPKCNITGK